jgi:hypothetical protein
VVGLREPLEEDLVGALEVLAQPPHDPGGLGEVADLEQRVARVRGQRAEDVGPQHRHDHRAVAARGLPRQPAVVAARECRVAGVHEGHDLVAEVVRVAAGGGGVEELRAAVARPRVGEHDERRRALGGGEQRVDALDHRRLEGVAAQPHVELAGEALDLVDDRERLRVVELHARRAVDPQRAPRRVAERVLRQQLGLDDEPVERAVHRPLPRRAGRPLDLPQAHAPLTARSGSGAKNGVET